MHQIFHIPELLMQIVLCLDPMDLPSCSGVSQHWRTTIKNNLPPRFHRLPDSIADIQKVSREPLPCTIRDLATSIQIQNECCILSAQMLELGDEYLCWREGTHAQVLGKIRPYLHPFLSTNTAELVSGLDSITRGHLEICLQTKCTRQEFIELLENENWRAESMSQPFVRSVEVYAWRGAKWDLSNQSVKLRGRETWAKHMVRIERVKGVRMGDVVDELMGTLVPEMSEDDDQRILLEWKFES